MFCGEEDSDFQKLPPEKIIDVLSHVDLKGKQSARLVCRRWRWILDHPETGLVSFKHLNGELTEESIQCLLKTKLHIDHFVLHDVKMTWPSMTYTRNKFPHIQKLTVGERNSDKSLKVILRYGSAKAKSLTLDNYCFSHLALDILSSVLSGMRWNKLTELSLKVTADASGWIQFPGVGVSTLKKWQENNVKGITLILKEARIPNLRVLSLELVSLGTQEVSTGITGLMSNFAIFLEHHTKTLKELRLVLPLFFFRPCHEGLTFPNISAPLFSEEQQKSVAQDLKLECLDISTKYMDALVHLVPPCVWESQNLTNLNWDPLGATANPWLKLNPISTTKPGTVNPIQSLFQRSGNTLTNVTTTFISGDIDVDPFQISWLESCPHLRELTLTNCDKLLSAIFQLPTVRKLVIRLIEDFDSVENMSIWISRAFGNLDAVQFLVCFTTGVQNLEFDWIQNLLILPRLREIRFQFTYRYEGIHYIPVYAGIHDDFTGPNLIRQYCNGKARLLFRGTMQRGRDCLLSSGPCIIKILPQA